MFPIFKQPFFLIFHRKMNDQLGIIAVGEMTNMFCNMVAEFVRQDIKAGELSTDQKLRDLSTDYYLSCFQRVQVRPVLELAQQGMGQSSPEGALFMAQRTSEFLNKLKNEPHLQKMLINDLKSELGNIQNDKEKYKHFVEVIPNPISLMLFQTSQ
jgi:hypothetical protein